MKSQNKKSKSKNKYNRQQKALKSEEAMIQGIVEGSPEAVGIAVIRLDCGCRKMAAVDKDGEAASKVIIYRDESQSVCEQCQTDNGAFMRVKEEFIHWLDSDLSDDAKQSIVTKVLGTQVNH
ncbi:MAG: hypothetical protein ACLFV2_08850 [Desulfurivibrionaceae bacterium]